MRVRKIGLARDAICPVFCQATYGGSCVALHTTMLGPLKALLGTRPVVLASSSPRRRQLLQDVNFPVEVVPSNFEETLDKAAFSEPWRYAEETALGKAKEVAERLRERTDWAVVIGADTVVVVDGRILEKPASDGVAKEMLRSLSGREHVVFTGLALVWRTGHRVSHEATRVSFTSLTSETIDSYVASGEPLDKAGAYGIQGEGGTLVSGIVGDYFNVVGLPLHKLSSELSAALPAILLDVSSS